MAAVSTFGLSGVTATIPAASPDSSSPPEQGSGALADRRSERHGWGALRGHRLTSHGGRWLFTFGVTNTLSPEENNERAKRGAAQPPRGTDE
jgi:hypothetical protein